MIRTAHTQRSPRGLPHQLHDKVVDASFVAEAVSFGVEHAITAHAAHVILAGFAGAAGLTLADFGGAAVAWTTWGANRVSVR